MIREKLLDERAKEMAVSATDDEVEAAVARVKAQYNLTSDAEFDAALAESGMTRDDLRRQMRETITLQKVIGRDVTSRIDLSDDVLRIEYERRKEKSLRRARHRRTSRRSSSGSRRATPRRRRRPSRRSRRSARRSRAARPSPTSPRSPPRGTRRERGGDLGTVAKGELVEALDVAIFSRPTSTRRPCSCRTRSISSA